MISLKNVTKLSSSGNKKILDDVSLDINQGDFIVINSSLSSSKRMLGRILGAIEGVTEGEVYMDGVEVKQYSANDLAKIRRDKFSCLFLWQELDDSLTVKENVLLPLMYAKKKGEQREELAEQALTIVGMQRFFDANINKLNYWQKNKVLLARAIVTNPRVLILEEPCRMGEEGKINEVVGLLSALNKEGITIIVVTNRAEYESAAKRVIEIEDGKIVERKITPVKEEPFVQKPKRTTKKKKEEKEVQTELDINVETIDLKEDKIDNKQAEELASVEKQISIEELAKEEKPKKRAAKNKTKEIKNAD